MSFLRPGSLAWITTAFFFLGAAPGFWAPSVTNVLAENGLPHLVPWAFIPHSVAALLSPLLFGALADQRLRADRLLAGTCVVSAILLWFAFRSLIWDWPVQCFVIFLLLNALVSAPMWSLMATIAMRPMVNPNKHFPLVRLGGTIGWVIAGLLVGRILNLDGSPHIGDWAAAAKLVLGASCFMLPATYPEPVTELKTWKDRLGLGALSLLKERDQRVYFLTTAFLSVPLAAFYMYTPRHLNDLGDTGPSATMAWGQVSEIVAMLAVGFVLGRFRIKWVFTVALVFALVRYVVFARAGGIEWMVVGLLMHGLNYTFFFITGQVFMERRVPKHMRAQAQALLSVMASGAGGLLGYTGCYFLYQETARLGDWQSFWAVLTVLVALSLAYFVCCYNGKKAS